MTGAHMDPETVAEAGRRLQASGDRLATAWTSAKSAIAGHESGIGAGRLADAFRRGYLPAGEAARSNADPFPGHFAELSSATSISATIYLNTDLDSEQMFRRLKSEGD